MTFEITCLAIFLKLLMYNKFHHQLSWQLGSKLLSGQNGPEPKKKYTEAENPRVSMYTGVSLKKK